MTTPTEESSLPPADARSKEYTHLIKMAWIAVILTVIFGVVSLGHNPTVAWIFVILAVVSFACSAVAHSARKKSEVKAGHTALAMVISAGLFVFGVMSVLGLRNHHQSMSHAGNITTLSGLEAMLELHYKNAGKYPDALSALTEEVKIFPDAKVEHFATFVIPQTEVENAWIYTRISDDECLVKCEPYQFEGREVILILQGKGGDLVMQGDED